MYQSALLSINSVEICREIIIIVRCVVEVDSKYCPDQLISEVASLSYRYQLCTCQPIARRAPYADAILLTAAAAVAGLNASVRASCNLS